MAMKAGGLFQERDIRPFVRTRREPIHHRSSLGKPCQGRRERLRHVVPHALLPSLSGALRPGGWPPLTHRPGQPVTIERGIRLASVASNLDGLVIAILTGQHRRQQLLDGHGPRVEHDCITQHTFSLIHPIQLVQRRRKSMRALRSEPVAERVPDKARRLSSDPVQPALRPGSPRLRRLTD